MGARADAEPVAESGGQPTSGTFPIFAMVFFTHPAERRDTLFHRGVAHPTRVERPVQIVTEATVRMAGLLTGVLASILRGCLFRGGVGLGVLGVVGLLGVLGVEVDAAKKVRLD